MSKDRMWLLNQYFPVLEGRVLFVGVNEYTSNYPTLVSGIYESLDSCAERSKHGQTSHTHHNKSILEFRPPHKYDHISVHGCHGYKGYNIDNGKIREEMCVLDSILNENGTLQFGPACNLNIESYSKTFWDEFVGGMPFNNYNVIHQSVEGMNYIWWGRKQ